MFPLPFSAHLQFTSILLPLVSSAHGILTFFSHFWLLDSTCAVTNLFLQVCFIFLKMLKDATAPALNFYLVANPAPNIKRLNSFLQLFTTIIHQFISDISIGNYSKKFERYIFDVSIISKLYFGRRNA